jgi:hypothetical protein
MLTAEFDLPVVKITEHTGGKNRWRKHREIALSAAKPLAKRQSRTT